MSLTKLQPNSVNTTATFTFANINVTNTANLGDVANVVITGGSSGQYLQTDGAGNLAWAAGGGGGGGGSPGGIDTYVQFNDGGNFGGVGAFTFNKSTNSLVVGGNVTSNNSNLGNLATANYFSGNGSLLTGITASTAGTVTTNAQPNITSVGSLSGLTVSNVSGIVNFTTTANVTLGAVSNLHISGGTSGYVLSTDGSGGLSWVAQSGGGGSYGNSNVADYLPVYTGNVNANYFIGNGSTLTYVTGGNVSGNVTSAIQSHYANIANSVIGSNVSGQVGNALVAGTVYTNAQPNITSVGTLAGLTGTGIFNLTGTSNVALGAVGNVHITGGTSGYVLSTDGSGALSWVAQSGGGSSYGNSNVADYLPTYTGNVSANYFIGNGATLTYIIGSNVNGNVTSAIQSHYANIANSVAGGNVSGQVGNALVAGTVYTNAQPNITSVGTLVSLSVSGDATVTGNFTVGGNTTYINVETFRVEDPIIELGGGVNGAALISNDGKDRGSILHYYTTGVVDAFMGWDNSNGEFAFGSNVSVSSEVVTFNSFGNIRANNFLGTATTAGTVTTNAQPNITSVGTLASLTVTANISSGNADLGNLATASYFSGNGIFISNIAGANVSGTVANATYATSAGSATTAATVTTNAQPNITSVGSLTGLTVSNATGIVNFTTTANVTLGAVANLHISGGTSGYVLSTDGSGTLSWVAQSGGGGGTPGGSNTQVQFNDNGSFGGNSAFTFDKTTGNVVMTGNLITGSGTGGNISGLNYVTANYFTGTLTTAAQPNVTSLGTLVSLTVTGNITSGNASLGNLASATYLGGTLTTGAQPNITSVGSLGSLTVTGLITNTGTGIKTSNIQDSSGTITIVTGYGSVSGAVGIYGNITAGTSGTGFFVGNGSYLSGLTGGNVSGQVGNALVAGTVYTNAQPNITSVGTLASLTVTGNITSGNAIIGSGSGGSISGANLVSANYFTGTLTTGAQPNITSVGTLINTTLGASNSITGGNLVSATYLTGTLTTGAQPNITSVGSLSGLTVSNATGVVNFTTTANVTLGAVANLHISGGTSGYVLQTDGSGTLSWVAQSGGGGGGSPGGLDTYVQFNDGGTTFGGNAQLTYNKVTNLLSVGGNLTISGLTTLGETTDTLNTKTGATGSVTHDLSTGVVFYHTSISANFTAALTNAPTTDGRTIVVVLFLVQGATAYIPNAVTINGGAAVTIKWLFGSTPGGNANKTDCVSFTLIRTGSAWIVLGQLATYG
jgi:hypothetical protein